MKTIEVCGLPITIFIDQDLDNEILLIINSNLKKSFHGHSLVSLFLYKKIKNLYSDRLMNDYFLCDGRGFYYFMRMLGVKGVSKLSLPMLTMKLVKVAAENKKIIYLLGATEESNQKAQLNLKNNYELTKVFGRDGYFNNDEEAEIVQEINSVSPDILFLGISSPKKDRFLAKWKEQLNVKIIVNCGGMIDVISGKSKLYPKWVKTFCLAGVFRFLQEPLRLRRDFFYTFPSLIIALKILLHYKILKIKNNEFKLK